jgi:Tfp pilus assembly protein PilV
MIKKIKKIIKSTHKNFIKKFSSGFMIVEVMVGISIITVSVLAAMAVTQKSIYISRQSLHILQASFLLEEGSEVARITRDNSWNNISNLTVGTDYYPTFSAGSWTLSSTPSAVGIFTRTLRVANVNRDTTTGDIVNSGGVNDVGTKLVTVTVSWTEGGNALSRTLSFYVMDIFS